MKPRLTRSLQRILIVAAAGSAFTHAADLTWNGQADSNTWNTQTTNTNWLNAGSAAPFVSGDNVTFAIPAGTESTTVQVADSLQAGTMTVDSNYTVQTTAESSISATMSGTGTLTKSGEYMLSLHAAENSTNGPALAVAAGNLALSGTATYRELSSMADDTQIQIVEGADITFANASTGSDVVLQGNMQFDEGPCSLNTIAGSGTLSLQEAAILSLSADSEIGTLSNAGTLNASGNLLIENPVDNGGKVSATRLILNNGGNFNTIQTNNLVIGNEITTTAPAVTTQSLGVLNGENVQVDVASTVHGSGDYLLVSTQSLGTATYTLADETVERYRNIGYQTNMQRTADGLVLTLAAFNNGYYTRNVYSPNGKAGAILLDQAFGTLDPQANSRQYTDLALVLNAMDAYLADNNRHAADKLAANVAGAGLANLNSAWRGQMERQLNAIRNRITGMQGGISCYSSPNPKAPLAHHFSYTMWANAEIDYQNQGGNNSLPGYKLNSIGGTAGFAMFASRDLTIGAAFTGMAGRLSSKGFGSDASGDLDAYYANFFMRMDTNCWQHSLIGSVGWADVKFNRRVNFPGGNYSTHGSTDGLAFGLMYELAYSYQISEDTMKSAWWQPVINVSYIHSQMDAYTESGSDAALRIGKQDSNNVIFGFGARMQGIVGEQWLNTPAIMEARILGKALVGARAGKAHVSIPGVAAQSTVRGAEPSAIGLELGMGFNIPLGSNLGTIFTDFTAEFYQDQNSVNGTLGYRFNF